MGLLRPTPGEIVDRQTILQLKMKAAEPEDKSVRADQINTERGAVARTLLAEKGKVDIQPWVWEHEELQKYLESDWFPLLRAELGTQFDNLMDQLSEVNASLWKLEDEARALRAATKTPAVNYRAAVVLFEINDSNDRRIELSREIDKLFGIATPGKIYAG